MNGSDGSVIYYRFRHTLNPKTLLMDNQSPHAITVSSIQEAIMKKEKLLLTKDKDKIYLRLINAETKHEYIFTEIIPNYTSIIVLRVPFYYFECKTIKSIQNIAPTRIKEASQIVQQNTQKKDIVDEYQPALRLQATLNEQFLYS